MSPTAFRLVGNQLCLFKRKKGEQRQRQTLRRTTHPGWQASNSPAPIGTWHRRRKLQKVSQTTTRRRTLTATRQLPGFRFQRSVVAVGAIQMARTRRYAPHKPLKLCFRPSPGSQQHLVTNVKRIRNHPIQPWKWQRRILLPFGSLMHPRSNPVWPRPQLVVPRDHWLQQHYWMLRPRQHYQPQAQ